MIDVASKIVVDATENGLFIARGFSYLSIYLPTNLDAPPIEDTTMFMHRFVSGEVEEELGK